MNSSDIVNELEIINQWAFIGFTQCGDTYLPVFFDKKNNKNIIVAPKGNWRLCESHTRPDSFWMYFINHNIVYQYPEVTNAR